MNTTNKLGPAPIVPPPQSWAEEYKARKRDYFKTPSAAPTPESDPHYWERHATYWRDKARATVRERDEARAELAAAQAEARELREACEPLIEAIIEMQHDSNTDYKLGSLAQLDFNAVFNSAVKLGAALAKKKGER